MEPFNALMFAFFSLMKDMTGKEDQFRGPAIRALCSITDVSILTARVFYTGLLIRNAPTQKRSTRVFYQSVLHWPTYKKCPYSKEIYS